MLTPEQIIRKLSSMEALADVLKKEATELKGMLDVSTSSPKRARKRGITEEEIQRRLAKRKKVMFKGK